MPTRNINLTDHLNRFIETRVTSGRYGNASEIVREGLRLLERREQEEQARLEWLRKAAKEGFDQIDRGEGIELHSIKELDEEIDQLGKEASAELASVHDPPLLFILQAPSSNSLDLANVPS